MYITPENKMKINAMYYRDGMKKEEIAKKMDFTLSFIERYIASVDRRIERKQITKESIINGVTHFGVPTYKGRGSGSVDTPVDVVPEEAKVKEQVPEADKPEAKLDLKNFKVYTEKEKEKVDLMLPVFKSLVKALEGGRLSLASINMSHNIHIIELKEVNK